ncbi:PLASMODESMATA CALLOSE-BINDING PROTEIN 5-like isoform X2 [Rutidosis leptorrhynchoides]|uniref:PLASMODESMATA CALLOSE-BINDING PROTEIN 5-like isoform X2 n=1 Tax=Rutidosis leptorrhynchoides TaxID=125765 RepID=UPI003A992047
MSLFLCFTLLFTSVAIHRISAATSPTIQLPDGVTLNLWCVAKNNAEDSALQSAIDWACGIGGADCTPIQQGGPCYDPADIRKTASYAFNNYCTKNGMTEDTCNFANTAALTSLDPSHSSCKFPSSLEGKNIQGTSAVGGASTADLTTT